MADPRFEGKTVIVTGAAGDIGRATCRQLSGEGATILAVDRDQVWLDEAVGHIGGNGGAVHAHVADVADLNAVKGYVDAARELGGGSIDAFFNNAGIEGPTVPIKEYPEDSFEEVVAVNLTGWFLGLKHVSAAMESGATIVNTSSVGGVIALRAMAGYVAAKHGVIGLTRVAALDLGPRGIRVNAICRGPVEGRMMSALEQKIDPQHGHEFVLSTVPLGRYTTPAEIASTAAFLLSADSGFANGAVFVLDGGQTAQ